MSKTLLTDKWQLNYNVLCLYLEGVVVIMIIMVVVFTTIRASSVYHHQRCEVEHRSWQGVLNATSCDKIGQLLRLFSPGAPVSSTNKTDRHDITEILLKVALNTITLPLWLLATKDIWPLAFKHFWPLSLSDEGYSESCRSH